MVILMKTSLGSGKMEITIERLINKIVSSPNAYFKSQQIDDVDLTADEKRQIVREILEKGPSKFLERFGKHLSREDLVYFERFRDDYEVTFFLNEIEKRNSEKTAKTLVKNRRYEALKKLIEGGEYFSDSEMKKRNPFAFEQMIGQYLSEHERQELDDKIDHADHRFSTILMDQIDRSQEENLRKYQEAAEEIEEEESDTDEEEVTECRSETITDEEKHIFREEFLSNMYQNFLDGKDEEFNYTTVDENAEYDSVEETQQDAEDSYFDSEAPNTTEDMLKIESDESMDYDADISNFVK